MMQWSLRTWQGNSSLLQIQHSGLADVSQHVQQMASAVVCTPDE